jgi:two-component system phosphate regulon sensor histidine kinase PhoR
MSGSWLRSIIMAAAPALVVLALMLHVGTIVPPTAMILAAAILIGVSFAVRRRLALEDVAMRRLKRLTEEAQAQLDALSYKAAVADKIVASLPHPIFFLDKERLVVRANAVAHALIDTDLTGRDIADGLRDPALLSAIDRAIEFGEPQTVDLRLPVPVETEFIVRVQPVEPPRGTPMGRDAPVVLIDMQDVTALRRLEQMRVDFVANVSHELRTPLTSLTGFIETLRGPAKDDPDAREKFLSIMQEQSGRMFRLINDLLSLSRIELEEHSRPREEIRLDDLLRRLVQFLSQKAEAVGIEIRLDMPDDLPTLRGDEDQLFQVFQNLLDNALKYGAKGETVELSVERRDHRRLVVSITDHGAGIAPEHIPRLTERFYRVDAARSRELGGTGLGLAIVKHILNRHRGRLNVTSEVGRGSTFSVTLPIPAEFRDAAATPESRDPEPRKRLSG